MRSENNGDGLEAPRNHGPFTRKVNPVFTGVTREQGGERKRERNGEPRVTGIKIGWMNDHFWILQKRVQAVAIQTGERFEHAAGVHGGEGFERALNEIVQDEE